MNGKTASSSNSAAERILAVAGDLFYRQGYRATGVNQVIEEAGVAKATFYNHFRSKEALAQAYIEEAARAELEYLDGCIAVAKDPLERLLAVVGSVGPWMEKTGFRGCPFINLAAEVPDPASPLRRTGMKVYSEARGRVALLARDLVVSEGGAYGHLDPDRLTDDYMLVFTGAIALAGIHHAIWPVDHALAAARRLVEVEVPNESPTTEGR